ncbi:MAG: hypothetical protein ACPGRC_08345 [Salibacteraceae bacterium]
MKISKSVLEQKLGNNFKNKIMEAETSIKTIDAQNLLTPERFDLLAKILYIKYYESAHGAEFYKELYLKHIEIFNGFFESDGSGKIGEDGFINSFNDLINSVKSEGIKKDVILPASTGNVILDGAHRTATAIYFNDSIQIAEIESCEANFDYQYFKNGGLKEYFLDEMALEYINQKQKDLYLMFLWPTGGNDNNNEVDTIIKSYGKIVYRKEIDLSENGSVNLIRSLYENESWVGSFDDRFAGAHNKARWCFSKDGKVKVVLLDSSKDMIALKEEIRDLFSVKKHSVHITDTYSEVYKYGRLVFNNNSVHWLNHFTFKNYDWFNKLLSHFVQWQKDSLFDLNDFCIDGSASLSAYGIRVARDVDFLYGKEREISTGFKEIDCHNERLNYDLKQIGEIIYDPRNHFYYKSVKFISLNLLREYKINRGEKKDLIDIEGIDSLNNGNELKRSVSELMRNLISLRFWKARVKFFLFKIRYHLHKFIYAFKN